MKLTHLILSSVVLAASSVGAFAAAAPVPANLISNGDFSFSNVASGSYLYGNGFTSPGVSATPWTFASGSGVANNSSAWGGAASTGSVAFLQSYSGFSPNTPSISQVFSSTSSAFSVSFDLAKRTSYGGVESIIAAIDGHTFSFSPLTGSLSSNTFTVAGLTSGPHTLSFTGTNSTGASDASVFLDNVRVTAVPEPESYAMMLAGLGLMGSIARRRKNKNA